MTTCHDILEEIKELIGGGSKEPFSGSTNTTHTFSQPMTQFVIYNDGDTSLSFTINNQTWTVLRGEQFDDRFDSFTTVTITTTVDFRAYGRE